MTNVELEKARLRRTEKGDRRKGVIGVASALFVLFGFVAFLNLIDSVNLAFRATQGNVERFLYWLVGGTLGVLRAFWLFCGDVPTGGKRVQPRPAAVLRRIAEAARIVMMA